MKQGITKCGWCLTESTNENSNCTNCGGPIAILEPWVLQCGWCGTSNRRDLIKDCKNCGGELPNIPGLSRQPEPPTTPRFITDKLRKDILFKKNLRAKVGTFMFYLGFFSLCVGVGLILIPFGYYFKRKAKKEAADKLNALKNGVPTKGIIQENKEYMQQSENGVRPHAITYQFFTPGTTHESEILVWDEANWKRQKGEHLWIVFDPDDPTINTPWPPMV